jgi:L-ribulose-5-phosphate 3-epimerase
MAKETQMGHRITRRDFLTASLVGALGARLTAAGATSDLAGRLAVCSWSLQPASADDLLTKLAATGLTRLQIALDPIRNDAGGAWRDFAGLCARHGVTCVSGMFGTVGEDYTTLDSIRRTGGVVPDATWADTWRNIQADAEIAEQLGLRLVTFHAGFLPHEAGDPTFATLQARLQQIAGLFAARKMAVAFETGQEEAGTLAGFLRRLGRANVGVNFDPANMLLYGEGDPVAALRTLAPWLRQCHVKDAVRTKTPGTWGQEVPVGSGQVDWKAFFSTLDAVRFTGDLCIEREAGNQRVADIRAAREFVERLTK